MLLLGPLAARNISAPTIRIYICDKNRRPMGGGFVVLFLQRQHRLFHTSFDYEVITMEQFENQVLLRGTIQNLPQFSHENHGRKFYRFYLEVPRLSGTVDTLPIIAELGVLQTLDLSGGGSIRVEGQIRSHNLSDETGRHLLVFVFASLLVAEDGPAINEVRVTGSICKTPNYRRTPLGREICDVMLAVPRAFKRADYLPCILWGRTAQEGARCVIRDQLHIYGRLQSRLYTKYLDDGPQERTAYEISALTAEQVNDPAE